MRFIFSIFMNFFKLKFILWGAAAWFIWSTAGTFWTALLIYGAMVFLLFRSGPSDKKGILGKLAILPTRGSPYALIAPLVICFFFPLCIISALMATDDAGGANQ